MCEKKSFLNHLFVNVSKSKETSCCSQHITTRFYQHLHPSPLRIRLWICIYECGFVFYALYASLSLNVYHSTCYDYDFVPTYSWLVLFACVFCFHSRSRYLSPLACGVYVYVSYGIVSKWEMICCFTFNSITTIYVLIY